MPSFQMPSLMALVLAPAPACVTLKSESVHATEITLSKEPAKEVIKRTATMMNEPKVLGAVVKQFAKIFTPTHSSSSSSSYSFPSVWALFKFTGLSKMLPNEATSPTLFPTSMLTSLQLPAMFNLIAPIIAILFIQLVVSEVARSTNTNTQALLKGFAQRALVPINTPVGNNNNNSKAEPDFPNSVDSGFADVEEKHRLPLPSYESDDMVPEAVDLVPDRCDQCEPHDDVYQELLRQLALGVLQYTTTAVSQEVKELQSSLDNYLGPANGDGEYEKEEYDEGEEYEEYDDEEYSDEEYSDEEYGDEEEEHADEEEEYGDEEYDKNQQHRSKLFFEVLQYLDTAVSDELKALQPRLNDYLRSEEECADDAKNHQNRPGLSETRSRCSLTHKTHCTTKTMNGLSS